MWQVYDAAFDDCDEDTWRTDTYARHLARPDFRLVGAWAGKRLVGFGYGYTGHRGEYWPDRLMHRLPQERALLSTEVGDTPAVRLYSSRGWVRLGLLDSRLQVMGTPVTGDHR